MKFEANQIFKICILMKCNYIVLFHADKITESKNKSNKY